jgi:hypothetical protein
MSKLFFPQEPAVTSAYHAQKARTPGLLYGKGKFSKNDFPLLPLLKEI